MKLNAHSLVLVLFVAVMPLVSYSAEELQKSYTDEQLIEILKNEGFRAVEKVEDRIIKIKVDGLTYVLYVYEDDDLQLYFGATGYELPPGVLNEWNRTKRLSRAYIDEENDSVVESDLLANAGYTEKQFIEWILVFDGIVGEFRRFLDEHDEAE